MSDTSTPKTLDADELLRLVDAQSVDRLTDATMLLWNACKKPGASSMGPAFVILADLRAKGLPKLVSTIKSPENDIDIIKFLSFMLLTIGDGSASLERYAHQDRADAVRLFEAALDCASDIVSFALDKGALGLDGRLGSSKNTRSAFLVEMLSALVCVIRAIKPPRSAIPFSVPVTEGLLESCATLLKNEPSHNEDDVPPAVKSAVFLKTYLDPMTSDSALAITPVDDEDFMPLHACEATRYGAATKESCAEHNALQVCSRCKTVAYCGSVHQRAHWKYHKPTCFKPTW